MSQAKAATYLFAFAAFVAAHASNAVVRTVPDDFLTIQSAVDASSHNDTILVRPGTYVENVNFHMRNVILRSIAGPELTTIDGSQPVYQDTSSVVYLRGIGESARLEGFTLRGGNGTVTPLFGLTGGGISIIESNGPGPTIEDNLVTQNTAATGGGVYLAGSCRIVRNRISFNTAGQGAGLASRYIPINSFPQVVSENEIFGNRCLGSDYDGGGVSINSLHSVILAENLIACNEAERAGGIVVASSPAGLTVERNTIFANRGRSGVGGAFLILGNQAPLLLRGNIVALNLGGGLECLSHPGGALTAECNAFFFNNPDLTNDECGITFGEGGNIVADPLFGAAAGCPPAPGDLCLSAGSPLLPENSPPGCGLIGARGLCPDIGIAEETPAPQAPVQRLASRPNPFAERTVIPFTLESEAEVRVEIADARGRHIVTLADGPRAAGENRIIWDGRDAKGRRCPSGVYFARVTAQGRELKGLLLLLR